MTRWRVGSQGASVPLPTRAKRRTVQSQSPKPAPISARPRRTGSAAAAPSSPQPTFVPVVARTIMGTTIATTPGSSAIARSWRHAVTRTTLCGRIDGRMRFAADRPLGVAPATVLDYRELARRRLPRQLFDYVDGGAYEEATMRANVADLERGAAAPDRDARRQRPRPGGRGAGPAAGDAGRAGAGRAGRDVRAAGRGAGSARRRGGRRAVRRVDGLDLRRSRRWRRRRPRRPGSSST